MDEIVRRENIDLDWLGRIVEVQDEDNDSQETLLKNIPTWKGPTEVGAQSFEAEGQSRLEASHSQDP